jgi:ParG
MSDSRKSLFSRPQAPATSVIGPDVEHFVRGVEAPLERPHVEDNKVEKIVPVQKEKPKEEPLKRLTIDIPDGLHKRVKAGCASQGITIAEVVREILERKFPEPKRQ